jgi:hypothetical protein
MYNKDQIEKIKTELNNLAEYDLECLYDEMLDDCWPKCKIAGYNYSTSDALKRIDPTAYRCGFNDWLDGEDDIVEVAGEYYRQSEIDNLLAEGY